MNEIILYIHSLLRWLVLGFLIWSLIISYNGWTFKRHVTGKENRIYLLALIIAHIQLLVGITNLILNLTIAEFPGGFGTVMKDAHLRFFFVEHPLLMLIGVAILTIGRIYSKKIFNSYRMHKRYFIFLVISLIVIFYSIPWPFSAIPRPLIPWIIP
ncbi:MAG: hypothetical protein HYY40_03985 [Bacteroidetes bacterium]|nr:hypothetical protein [Bacteroidota bacterium]